MQGTPLPSVADVDGQVFSHYDSLGVCALIKMQHDDENMLFFVTEYIRIYILKQTNIFRLNPAGV